MGEEPKRQTGKITFDINGIEHYIDINVSVAEYDDGTIIIGSQYGEEDMTYRRTSINNVKIVKKYEVE